MTDDVRIYWAWLNVLNKKRYEALIDVCGSLDIALQHVDLTLLKTLGMKAETAMKVLNRLDEFDPELHMAELQKRGIRIVSIEDEGYPEALLNIGDPPIFLHYKGDLSVLNQPCVALVGAREMSAYGKRVTETFVPSIVAGGCVTVSGLAQGIDQLVAEETLRAGGKTVAVLGHGLGKISPKSSADLAGKIIESGGLVITEYPMDMMADKYTFPARNRIIAGLSLGTVVLEAGEGSGALITSDLALDYGREVFAVPGQIFDPQYAGCHQAIANAKAKLVTDPASVLREIGIVTSVESHGAFTPQSDEESLLFNALTTMPQSIGDLVGRSGLKTDIVNATLTMMELEGAAQNVGNGLWVRR